MPWLAVAAAAPAIIGALSGNSGTSGGGVRGVNLQAPENNTNVKDSRELAMQSQAKQLELYKQLAAQGGIQNQSNVFNQGQGLAGQLQAESMGQGPNPAQAMLANSTGQNAAQQAALMGSQRGAGANAGLIARQAAMQGGALQQNAIGQGAALQAQQQLAAQQQLQQQQSMLAGLSTQQVGQQQNALMGSNQIAQNQQQLSQAALSDFNNANVNAMSAQGNQQTAQFGTNANNNSNLIGGALKGAGSAFNLKFAHGGMAPKPNSPASYFAQCMVSGGRVPGQAQVEGDSGKNDTVPAMLSPGEIVIPRSVLNSKDAPSAAARFVAAVLAKRK